MEIETFLQRCERFQSSTGMSRARLSTLLFGSGVTIARLVDGKGVTVRVLGRASDRLHDLERRNEAPSNSEQGAA